MLALATHEPHFCILREVVLDRKAQEKQKEQIAMGKLPGPPKMQFLQVWVLREYLHVEFSMGLDWSRIPGGFDLEKVIDDFVFMCFFVGNDFLPHIPALEYPPPLGLPPRTRTLARPYASSRVAC